MQTSLHDVVIEWEPLDRLQEDGLSELIHEHWMEVSVHKAERPLAVDWDRYEALEQNKILRLLGARMGDRLIGYASYFYLPHLHYCTTKAAPCDAIFVQKHRRRSGAGVKMIEKAERDFAAEAAPGWVNVTYHDRCGVELLGPVLRKRGYIESDKTFSLMIRGA